MIGTTEEARVSKQARVVGEVAVDKTVEEREETVRDTVRKTDVEVEEVGAKSRKGKRSQQHTFMPQKPGAVRRASSSFQGIHLMTDLPLQGAAPSGFECAQPTVSEDAHALLLNQVSWGAIFAGVVVALVVQVLLTMLGVGIGIATLDPGTGDNPAASTFSVVTGPWYVVSGILAAFAGGYIAARMSGKTAATTGALHGLTTWAFTTLLVLYLLSTAVGSIVGGAFSGVANAVGGMGQTVAQAADRIVSQSNPLEAIENQVRATGLTPKR